ncbi:MAG: Ig-like domain-containing protein, partial [Methanobrevibacter sp.]|jgi:hypothetical protein|nr:Ig-like domain-containing protein [Candidatus Methanovirga procula]
MCLNGSNNTGNISNLPDFNATIKLSNNAGMLRFSPFMMPKPFMSPGDSVNILAKNPWNDTINNPGNYTFSALVDNQQLNINITAEPLPPTYLNLTANNITLGENTNITANLTNSSGVPLVGKNVSFGLDGKIFNLTTDAFGVAVLNNYKPTSAKNYDVIATFNGDSEYSDSSNSTSFEVYSVNPPTPPTPNPPSPDDSNNGTNHNGGGDLFGGNGLAKTGFPLIVLAIFSVLGLIYWRKK